MTGTNADADNRWDALISKGHDYDVGANGSWSLWTHRPDTTNNNFAFKINTASSSDSATYINENTSGNAYHHPTIIAMGFDGSNSKKKLWFDGNLVNNVSLTGSSLKSSTYPVTIGGHSGLLDNGIMHISEVMVFKNLPSTTDQQFIEGYLAHKWGTTSDLVSGHPYASSFPEGGWKVSQGSTSSPDHLNLDFTGSGSEHSVNVPVNDNNWHHIATTFLNGVKKVYIDGVLVSTDSQSGSITDSNYPLQIGSPIFLESTRPKISDLRIYRYPICRRDSCYLLQGKWRYRAAKICHHQPIHNRGSSRAEFILPDCGRSCLWHERI